MLANFHGLAGPVGHQDSTVLMYVKPVALDPILCREEKPGHGGQDDQGQTAARIRADGGTLVEPQRCLRRGKEGVGHARAHRGGHRRVALRVHIVKSRRYYGESGTERPGEVRNQDDSAIECELCSMTGGAVGRVGRDGDNEQSFISNSLR